MRDHGEFIEALYRSSFASKRGGGVVMTRSKKRRQEEEQRRQRIQSAKGIGEPFDNPSNLINHVIASTQLAHEDTDTEKLFGVVWKDAEFRPNIDSIPMCLEWKEYTHINIRRRYHNVYKKVLFHAREDMRNDIMKNRSTDMTEEEIELMLPPRFSDASLNDKLLYSSFSPKQFAELLIKYFKTTEVQTSIHADGLFYNWRSARPTDSEEVINRHRLYRYEAYPDELKGIDDAYYRPVILCEGSNKVEAFSIWFKNNRVPNGKVQ